MAASLRPRHGVPDDRQPPGAGLSFEAAFDAFMRQIGVQLESFGARAVNYPAADTWVLASLRDIHCEHQNLFALVSRYFRQISCSGQDALLPLLDEIVAATVGHFATEEEFLEAIAHPTLAFQKAAHRPIVDDLIECRDLVRRDADAAKLRAAHAMDALLIHHVRDDVDIEVLTDGYALRV